jgi:hypothetical protein
MPDPAEIILRAKPPRVAERFRAEVATGALSRLLFRFYTYGQTVPMDLSTPSAYVQMTGRDLGKRVDLPTVLASRTHPDADWSQGLVAIPIGPGNFTNRPMTALASVILSYGQPASERLTVGAGTLEVGTTEGWEPGSLEYPEKPQEGATGWRYHQCFTNALVVDVVHNLHGYPSIVIRDGDGEFIIADTDYLTEDYIRITFLIPTTGCVYLN